MDHDQGKDGKDERGTEEDMEVRRIYHKYDLCLSISHACPLVNNGN